MIPSVRTFPKVRGSVRRWKENWSALAVSNAAVFSALAGLVNRVLAVIGWPVVTRSFEKNNGAPVWNE